MMIQTMENNMTETQDEVIVEENNDTRSEEQTEVVFTPEIELDETLNNVEVKENTVDIETREAVFPIEFREDAQSRTMTMSVSSESPVAREFGNEVLSHRDGDIDLSRLMNKAPLLKDHDMRQQIGVIEDAYLDTQRGKLMTKVRFGRGTLASEQFQDVQDGIRTQVSIGYQINPDSFERSDDSDDVVVRDWMPIEVSLVSSGADQNVGFGRSLSLTTTKKETKKENPMSEENTIDVEEQIRAKSDELMKHREKEIAEILELGARHNKSELAKTSIRDGVDLSGFRGALLQEIGNTPLETEEIGLNKDETRSYSIVRVAKAMAHPTNLQYQKDAEFEFECSRAYQEKTGKETKGVFVPEEVQKNWVSKDLSERTLNTAGGSAGALVYEDLRYNDLIEALTPFSTVLSANPTVLSGLTGNVSIPRVSATATSGWVAEGTAVASSDPTIGSVTLSQKTGGAFTDVTRTLMTNTDGFSVENMVRNDLARSLGTLFDQASLNNGGGANAPTGIEQVAGINAVAFGVAGAPTYAEIISMESAIYTDNYDLGTEAKFITTPALNGYMKTLATNGAGSPVASRDGFVDGYQVLISSQVTANSIILGDFSQFLVGVWGGLEITADPYALSTSGGMRIIALSSVDFAVRNPVAFCLGA